ncbi:PilZ domain-containing protein [Alteriqipengyuania sp.]|uniref:PilZ domain-containing protein n=1 Tax=Alteriqipengyuania sp. TaxID=2800692 RepID=UPI003518978C
MSTNSNIAQFPGTGAQDVAPANDRRKNERQIATFRTCCVVIDGEARPAILRNLSDGGAMFEALVPAKPDTHLTYWWDGIDPVEARVAWVSGNRIGVANLSGPAEVVDVPRPRATRVPARLPVRVWSGCKGHRAQMADISLSGIAVEGLEGIRPGTLCTIEISGQALHNATVVRHEGDVCGIRFEKPLAPARLMQLLEGGGPVARVLTRPTSLSQIGHAMARTADEPKAQSEPKPEPVAEREAEPAPAAPIPLRRFL